MLSTCIAFAYHGITTEWITSHKSFISVELAELKQSSHARYSFSRIERHPLGICA